MDERERAKLLDAVEQEKRVEHEGPHPEPAVCGSPGQASSKISMAKEDDRGPPE